MRRPFAILALAVCGLVALPSRADAYIWDWIDDLSGPSFWGLTLEIRFWCDLDDARQHRGYLRSVRGSVRAAREKYASAASVASGARQEYLNQAGEAAARSLGLLDKAIQELDANPTADVTTLVADALTWRVVAEERFERGQRLPDGSMDVVERLPSSTELEARTRPKPTSDPRSVKVTAAGAGGTVSVCKTLPYERQSQFVTFNVSRGWDTDKAGVDHNNRMLTFGASYHKVVTPYFTVGGGGGVARFTSAATKDTGPVYTGYLHGFVDVRPLAMRRNSQLRGPWWHVPFFRYGVVTFPGGFENGTFAGQTEAYGTELVQTFGIHFDTEPLIRKWRGKW